MRQLNFVAIFIFAHGQHLMMNPWEMLKRINQRHDQGSLTSLDNPAYSLLLKFWSDRCCHVSRTFFHPVLLAACFDKISDKVECDNFDQHGMS